MKKIIQNGEVDFSDEGGQAKEMLAGADVNRFILGLTTKQQIILRLRVSGEEIKYIARYLGTSTKSVQRELAGIKKAWKSYK
jgi:DNA-binding NarL/FixJ family response regulator